MPKPVLFLMVVTLLSGCATSPTQPLYDALGERDNIERVVEETLLLSIEDERIAHHFDGVDLFELRRLLTEQICEVSGGPCEYTGRDMAESHAGMAISRTEFNILLEHLLDSMAMYEVPTRAQNRLAARLAPMHEDIVEQE